MDDGRLESINISRGGVPKTGVFEALITADGLDGDSHRDLRFHGGPDRAVVLFSLDVIRLLQAEGHPIHPGSTGENLTVSGIQWDTIVPGTVIAAGPVQLLVTNYTSPCEKIRHSFDSETFTRISQKVHPGWSRVSARVVEGGVVRVGDSVRTR
jgi:MOSC domain-containing protein YiiM